MTDRELLESILNKVNGIESKVNGIENKVNGIEIKVNGIETQQQEDHQIIKNLEHNSSVNCTEYDNMLNKITQMEGRLKNIDETIDAVKAILGRHEVDITVLKRRPV